MSWGLLGGLGQGLQEAGAAMGENARQQRIQEWQQKVRLEDRDWQNKTRLEDREYQAGIRAEDIAREDERIKSEREFLKSESERERQNRLQIAGMNKGAGTSRRFTQVKQIDENGNEVYRILDTVTGQYQDDVPAVNPLLNETGLVDPDADVPSGQPTGTKVDLDTAKNTLNQFNNSGRSGGLLGGHIAGSGNDWQRLNEEHQRLKPVIESVRRNLKAGFPMGREEYQEVYHLLSPDEREKLDQMQSQRGRQPSSGQPPISNVIFPQFNN